MENVVTWVLLARLNAGLGKAIEQWTRALDHLKQSNEALERASQELAQGNQELKEVKDQLSIIAQLLKSLSGEYPT